MSPRESRVTDQRPRRIISVGFYGMRIRTRIESLNNDGSNAMELSDKERDGFLNRIGAVQKLRASGEVVPGVYVQEDGKEWDDEDIKMLIAFGF